MEATKRIVLIVTFLCFSWLAMQVVHEMGHVLIAWLTGGEVVKVALHPLIVSRTDLGVNPHPLAVVWGGPLLVSLLPLLLFAIAWMCSFRALYLFRFFAGFCLIANGIYIGTGWAMAEGADPAVMRENGSPVWVLVVFGILTAPFGLYLWHRQGPHFGLGGSKGKVSVGAAITSSALLLVTIFVELVRNEK